ncbi:MARVEL domain-containing protein [Trichostrongylus colubriformis]|uniref:MARVEL domain-containing protein n=1 Tax=Trichostrongylus colubriformis TaxID=6319 RepID=A0AAN8FQR4_TRICO
MSFTNLREQIEHSDNVFLKIPHIFKPLQVLNAIILAICVGSTAGSENGVLWFVIITSMLISIAATVLFALGIQDSMMDSLTNSRVPWNIVELVYSFIFAILSVICVWLSFGFANRHLGGTSAGYIAAGLFFIVHASLYSIPCAIIYDSVHANSLEPTSVGNIQPAHPFRDAPYQDL